MDILRDSDPVAAEPLDRFRFGELAADPRNFPDLLARSVAKASTGIRPYGGHQRAEDPVTGE